MIRSNTLKARQNVINYILSNVDFTGYSQYSHIDTTDFEAVRDALKAVFYSEKLENNPYYERGIMFLSDLFIDWCQGLPSALDTCYYYNRSAIDDLATILEESDTEKSRFTEAQACEKLSRLIFRELYR